MPHTADKLRNDALAIWQAGVEAVRSDRLVQQVVHVDGSQLIVADQTVDLDSVGRIVVVGCGKAGAGMAAGLEAALGDPLMEDKQLTGWVNVPDDCVRRLRRIHLHAARPPGVNEPTAAGVEGARRILSLVEGTSAADLCLCLISGGGSALLPAPVEAITLEDKLAVTRLLSGAGANIQQLNTVRKQLSRIKGGGLARACRAGRLISLIISDVLGDPLDVIASAPTVADGSTPGEALAILEQFGAREADISPAVFRYLEEADHDNRPAASTDNSATRGPGSPRLGVTPTVVNRIIGNNATAVQAAADEARRRGYATEMDAAEQLEGDAEELGRGLARTALQMRAQPGRRCLVSGGEPTVRLVDSRQRGLGGRNQQLVLAALEFFLAETPDSPASGVLLLSGGTDGEDGPTDAAGAWLDQPLVQRMRERGLDPAAYLCRNDAWHFFEALDGLIRTGPTHTNVCDIRIVLTGGEEQGAS